MVSGSAATHVWSDGFATNGGIPDFYYPSALVVARTKPAGYVIHEGGVFIGSSKEYHHWHTTFVVLTGGAIQCSATFKSEKFQFASFWVKKGGKLNATSCSLVRSQFAKVYVVHRSERHCRQCRKGDSTHTCAHTRMYTHTRTHAHMCTHVNMHARTHTHTRTHAHTHATLTCQ